MKKTHAQAAKDRRRALERQEFERRCTFCRRALPKTGVLMMLTPGGQQLRYCDEGCRIDHLDALQTMEARR